MADIIVLVYREIRGKRMRFFEQVNVAVIVDKYGKSVISSSVYLDRNQEIRGYIMADTESCLIQDAWCETVKSPDTGRTGIVSLDFMRGMNGHIDGKRKVSGILKNSYAPEIRYLMIQCINGLIQAESYFYKERGFKSREHYDEYWDILENNGCRMYSYPSENDLRWMDYIPQYERKRLLFSRFKNFEIEQNGDLCKGRGRFIDSYHELYAEITFDSNSGLLGKCDISYVRAPGESCFSNASHGRKLEGTKLSELTDRHIVCMFGRSEGCYHLVEILKDLLNLLRQISGRTREQKGARDV